MPLVLEFAIRQYFFLVDAKKCTSSPPTRQLAFLEEFLKTIL